MRIFVLGAGATGSLLAQLLERQGHTVWCGDRDPARARRFLGKKSSIPIAEVNARNLRGIVKTAKGCQLIINASASVFNEIVLRAALRLRAHYLDLSSHLTRNPFQSEQFRYVKRFEEKNRSAVINAGAAPGLTNLLVKRAADLLDEVTSVQIRLYKSSESDDPISQWSPEVSFDEAISHPRIYRQGKFKLAKRFSEIEKFRKALGELEFSLAVDPRVRNGFVERDFGRPLRDGVVAFAAFVKTNLDRSDFIEKVGGAFDEKIGETGSGAGVDHRRTVFLLETFDVAKLLGLKRVSREVRAQVEIMRA